MERIEHARSGTLLSERLSACRGFTTLAQKAVPAAPAWFPSKPSVHFPPQLSVSCGHDSPQGSGQAGVCHLLGMMLPSSLGKCICIHSVWTLSLAEPTPSQPSLLGSKGLADQLTPAAFWVSPRDRQSLSSSRKAADFLCFASRSASC